MEQPAFFDLEPRHNGRVSNAEAGLRKMHDGSTGPERLLRELVRKGLREDARPAAAALVLALDEEAEAP
jgi:hypothetical protein